MNQFLLAKIFQKFVMVLYIRRFDMKNSVLTRSLERWYKNFFLLQSLILQGL